MKLRRVFQLFPEKVRPEGRKKFKDYDGVNNIFNLAYEILSWKVHRAIVRGKLEPYLGFLHSIQEGKPSLVCDMQELYHNLIDDFVIRFCQDLKPKVFILKTETLSRGRTAKREYLDESKTGKILKQLDNFFELIVKVPRIRVGKKQTIETLINEEALLMCNS